MSPGSCSLVLTLLVSSFGQAHSPSFLPYPCWLASFPCYARAHSSERRWAGTAEVNGVLRLVGARCLSRFTAPSISRWTKPLPAHCAGPAGGRNRWLAGHRFRPRDMRGRMPPGFASPTRGRSADCSGPRAYIP